MTTQTTSTAREPLDSNGRFIRPGALVHYPQWLVSGIVLMVQGRAVIIRIVATDEPVDYVTIGETIGASSNMLRIVAEPEQLSGTENGMPNLGKEAQELVQVAILLAEAWSRLSALDKHAQTVPDGVGPLASQLHGLIDDAWELAGGAAVDAVYFKQNPEVA